MKCCSKENGLQTTDGKLVNGLLLCPLSKSISLKPITSRIHWYIPEIFSFPLLIGVIRRSKAGEKKRPMNGLFTGPQNKQTAGATVLLCIYVMTIMTLVVNSSITKLSQKRRTRKKREKYSSCAAMFCSRQVRGATIVSLLSLPLGQKIIEPNEAGARQHSIATLRAGVGCSLTAKIRA